MAQEDARKNLYYEVVDVKFPDYEKGRDEWLAKCNRYEMQHDVVHRWPTMVWSNGSFCWCMVFCCDAGDQAEY